MSEELLLALINGAFGLLGVIVGAVIAYVFQIQYLRRQLEAQNRQRTRDAFLEDVHRLDEQMRTQEFQGTRLTIEALGRDIDPISLLGWVFILAVMTAIMPIAFVPSVRRFFIATVSTISPWILVVITSFMGFAAGWALFSDVVHRRKQAGREKPSEGQQ